MRTRPSMLAAAGAVLAASVSLGGCATDVPTYEPGEKVFGEAGHQPGSRVGGTGSTGSGSRAGAGSKGSAAPGGKGATGNGTSGRPAGSSSSSSNLADGTGSGSRPSGQSSWRAGSDYRLPEQPLEKGSSAPAGGSSTPRRGSGGPAKPPKAPKPPTMPDSGGPDVVLTPTRPAYPKVTDKGCSGPAGGPWTVSFTVTTAPGRSRHWSQVTLSGAAWIGQWAGADLNTSFTDVCR